MGIWSVPIVIVRFGIECVVKVSKDMDERPIEDGGKVNCVAVDTYKSQQPKVSICLSKNTGAAPCGIVQREIMEQLDARIQGKISSGVVDTAPQSSFQEKSGRYNNNVETSRTGAILEQTS